MKGWTPPFGITSVISGPHKGAGHREGRAIDVALPRTKAGYAAIVDEILSGRWQSIGTEPDAVERLKSFAAQHHVFLFPDHGTGPHMHLEVGTWRG